LSLVAGGLAAVVALGCLFYVLATHALAFGGGKRPPGLARVMLRELASTLLLITLWPLWWLIGASYQLVDQGGGGERRPIILLHGFAMNRSQWLWLGHRLARRGVGPLYGTSYFSPQSVATSARHLSRFISRVMAKEGAERVDIIAHSLGGVVARYYIEQMGGSEHVAKLVTLGSPHRGTLLGRFGLSIIPSARELMADSELLAGLRPIEAVKYTSIWSRADAVVIPPDSSSVVPAGTDRVFEDLGHLTMLLSPRVVDAVVEALQ
jgi:triacylglycerol lipase